MAQAAEAVGAAALGVALLAAWRDGWQLQLFGVTLSVRALWRPIVILLVAGALRLWLARNESPRRVAWSTTIARFISGGILAAGVLAWLTFLSPYVGGADSYGYVSAADRISSGRLIQRETLAAILPEPEFAHAMAPLGYVPAARVPGSSVPAYPLGLPTLIAAAVALFGSPAAFYVSIAMGIALLCATHAIVRRWFGDRLLALTTTAMVSVHPLVVTYAIQPMSDLPATACYFIAVACLLIESRNAAFAGGVAAAVAFLIRPALLPAAIPLTALTLMSPSARRPRAAAFLGPLAIAVAGQAWLHWSLYGSVTATGYGSAPDLFALGNTPINAKSYGYWTLLLHGPVWTAGLIIGLWHLRSRSAWIVLVATTIGALVPYAIYRTYDHWETLRFLMPLVMIATMIAINGLLVGARRLTGDVRGTWIAIALCASLLMLWVNWLDRYHVFDLVRAQERFHAAGELVARATPITAVIITSLHSGSVRYYAERESLDWSDVPTGRLRQAIKQLQDQGKTVFVMLDGDEENGAFVARHTPEIDSSGWLPAGQYRDVRLFEIPRRD